MRRQNPPAAETPEPVSNIDRIYDQASGLFARYGFEGVTMRNVADASGVTLATVYYYFKTKEALFEEISQEQFQEFISRIATAHRQKPATQRLPSHLLASVFDAVMDNPTLFLLISRDLLHHDHGHRYVRSRRRARQFIDLIRQSVEDSGRQPVEERDVFALSALITGYCELALADDRITSERRQEFLQAQRAGLVQWVQRAFEPGAAPGKKDQPKDRRKIRPKKEDAERP